jgi:hypothetical protein
MSPTHDEGHSLALLLRQGCDAFLEDWNAQFGTCFALGSDQGSSADVRHWVWVELSLCGPVEAPLNVVLDARILRAAIEALGFVDMPDGDFGDEGLDAVRELANLMAGALSRVFSAAVAGMRVRQERECIGVSVLDSSACEGRVASLADGRRETSTLVCPLGGPWHFFAALPEAAFEHFAHVAQRRSAA